MQLNEAQTQRYARQLVLREIGVKGQRRLLESRVLIIGVGGLGSPAALYLAAAGVGTIGIADGDQVEVSNLQRQILHSRKKIGVAKVDSAKKTLEALNRDITVIPYHTFADDSNILDMIRNYDFIIDATDRIENKFLVNDACVLAEKPFSHAAVLKFGGQLMTYVPGKGPCYRCIFEDIPKDGMIGCRQAGVIGMLPGMIGSMQALEALKYLLRIGTLLTGRLLHIDGRTMSMRTAEFRNPAKHCRVCGEHADIHDLSWYKACGNACC